MAGGAEFISHEIYSAMGSSQHCAQNSGLPMQPVKQCSRRYASGIGQLMQSKPPTADPW
jgi:hypothetical protein